MAVSTVDLPGLPHVKTTMAYTALEGEPAQVRVFPASSGRGVERPPIERHEVPVYDCRPIADQLTLDVAGFAFLTSPVAFDDFYNDQRYKAAYYPEVIKLLKAATGALEVFVFDHNVRSQVRVDKQQAGVREPVDGAHNDYTLSSGPRRIREILRDNDRMDLDDHRAALINVWRPIIGPVQDRPLAICDARTTSQADFIATEIQHFSEGNLQEPSHVGQIYSFRHSPAHRWFYVSEMQPSEVMLLKCYDTDERGRARFTGHTGFFNPESPAGARPRESTETRTVVIYPEKKSASR